MKKRLIIFAVEFVALFAAFYFFLTKDDLWQSLFVSGFIAIGALLLDKSLMKLAVSWTKRLVKTKA